MEKQNGKFFDVTKTRDYFGKLADQYTDFASAAGVHKDSIWEMINTNSWRGTDAETAKDLLKTNKITLVDALTDLHMETLEIGQLILDKFAAEVDDALDARIDYNTLEKINLDYKNLYANSTSVFDSSVEQATSCQQRFSRYGDIRIPDYSVTKDALIDICGGDNDEGGFIFACMKKLEKFDAETLAMIEEAEIEKKADILFCRMHGKSAPSKLNFKFGKGFDLLSALHCRPWVINAMFNGKGYRTRYGQGDIMFPSMWRFSNGRHGKFRSGFVTLTADVTGKGGVKKKKYSTKSNQQEQTVDIGDYKTGNKAVDAEIAVLLTQMENGTLYEEDVAAFMTGTDADSINKQKALAHIWETDILWIDSHLANKNCKEQEKHIESIMKALQTTENNKIQNQVLADDGVTVTKTYVFNQDAMEKLQKYCSDDKAKAYIEELSEVSQKGDKLGQHTFDVKLCGAAVVFSMNTCGDTKQILFHQPDERLDWAIKYWDKRGDYEYTKGIVPDIDLKYLYKCASNSDEAYFIDKLLRSDENYTDVFVKNPGNIGEDIKLFVGNYMVNLALDDNKENGYKAYQAFINSAISATYKKGDVYYYRTDENLIFLETAAGMAADTYRVAAWTVDLDDSASCDALKNKIQIADQNEMILIALNAWSNENEYAKRITGFALDDSFNFKDKCSVDIYYTDYNLNDSATGYGVPQNQPIYGLKETFTVYEYPAGLPAVHSYCTDEYRKAKERKEEAERNVLFNETEKILKMVFPEGAAIYDKLKEYGTIIASGDYSGAMLDHAVEKVGEKNKAGKTVACLYDFVNTYNSEIAKHEAEFNEIENLEKMTTFYSKLTAESGVNSYTVVLDFDAIRLIRMWDRYGISYLYECDDVDNHIRSNEIEDGYYRKFSNDKERMISDIGKSCNETDEVIEKAMNTIIYGAAYTGTDLQRYETINDIPIDVLNACVSELDGLPLTDEDDNVIENVTDVSVLIGYNLGTN
ncbi:hypothetical protein SAMN02910298_02657 [Pseudobutyrivibrio sp. YE44]|uniref:hypothetical protein n=1 Tax=Pseudobutyrivibrio sp. YE44 TaxID=1520802 RepID=UPI000887FC71|nr:hypothetical protein [Pseudobutyrivibrio sp. YE44]SDB51946.1 hypothetical protein SAMN02910298_02657 [Pseudobutyrivibrio sp. YE44]